MTLPACLTQKSVLPCQILFDNPTRGIGVFDSLSSVGHGVIKAHQKIDGKIDELPNILRHALVWVIGFSAALAQQIVGAFRR